MAREVADAVENLSRGKGGLGGQLPSKRLELRLAEEMAGE
jgi:hypothetical protein